MSVKRKRIFIEAIAFILNTMVAITCFVFIAPAFYPVRGTLHFTINFIYTAVYLAPFVVFGMMLSLLRYSTTELAERVSLGIILSCISAVSITAWSLGTLPGPFTAFFTPIAIWVVCILFPIVTSGPYLIYSLLKSAYEYFNKLHKKETP